MSPFLRLTTKSRSREDRDLSAAGSEWGGEPGADDEQAPPLAPPNVSNLSFLRSVSMSRSASPMPHSDMAASAATAAAAAAASGGDFQGHTLLARNLVSAGGSVMASRKLGNMCSGGSSGTCMMQSCASVHQEDGMPLSRQGGALRVMADGRVHHGPVKNATQPNLGQYMHQSRSRDVRDLSTAGMDQGAELGVDDEQAPSSAPPNISNLSFFHSVSKGRCSSPMPPSNMAADITTASTAAASGGAFQGLTLSTRARAGTPLSSPSASSGPLLLLTRQPSMHLGLTQEATPLLPAPLSAPQSVLSPHRCKPSLNGDDPCGAGTSIGGLVERANSFQMGPTSPPATRSTAVSMNGGGSPSTRRRASVSFDLSNSSSGPASAGGSDMVSCKRGNMCSGGSFSGTATPSSLHMHQDSMPLSRLGGALRVTADGRVRHGPVKNATQPNLGQYAHQVGRPRCTCIR